MNKALLTLSFMSLGILVLLSVYAPQSAAIWLASTTHGFNVLRVGIMVILLVLLVTDPPRHGWLRAIVGVIAGVLGAWSLRATYDNRMELLDGASLLVAAIAMAIATIERTGQVTRPRTFPRKPTIHRPAPTVS